MHEERFTPAEVGDIIREASRRAAARAGGEAALGREDVVAIGRELGLEAAHVEQALEERQRRRRARQVRRAARRGLAAHAASYVLTLGLLLALDVLTGPGWWVHWPALGWGLGVLSHAAGVLSWRGQGVLLGLCRHPAPRALRASPWPGPPRSPRA